MTQGAPDAIQVADRFHLLKNVTEVLKLVLAVHGRVLKLAPVQSPSEAPIRSEDFEKSLITVETTNEAQQQFEQRRTRAPKDLSNHLATPLRRAIN